NYEIDIKVNYDEVETENGKEITNHYQLTKIYYLPIYGKADFEINVDNTSITPGRSKFIHITIKNDGTGTAKYLSIYLKGNEKINVLGGSSVYLGCLNAGEQKTIPIELYAIPEIEDGIYSINAELYWTGEDGNRYNTTIPINIRVLKKIYPDQPFIYLDDVENKGDYVELTVGIANRGNSKIKHCVMILNIDNKNYTRYIGDLDEDDYDTAVFKINKFGNLTLNVEVSYFDDYHKKYNLSKTFHIGVEKKEEENFNPIYAVIGIVIVCGVIFYLIKRRKRKFDEFEDIE
ncbi:COG1361 S-layer family protein, partial [Methanocaldococcus sp.]